MNKDPFDFLDKGLDKLDGALDKMDGAFDKMDGMFNEMSDMFDNMDFGDIDGLHIKIQKVKDKFNISTAEALKGYKASYERATRAQTENHELAGHYDRMTLKRLHRRKLAALRNLLVASVLLAISLAFGLVIFFGDEDTSSAPPLVEHSAPLNPTLDSSSHETDIPKLKVVD